MEDVLWQLEYPGGVMRREPPEHETILHAPKGYRQLYLINPLTGQPLLRIEIPPKRRVIFYRNYSAGFGEGSRLNAVVFGHGLDPAYAPDNFEIPDAVTLWAWDGKLGRNATQSEFREGSIKNLLTAEVGT